MELGASGDGNESCVRMVEAGDVGASSVCASMVCVDCWLDVRGSCCGTAAGCWAWWFGSSRLGSGGYTWLDWFDWRTVVVVEDPDRASCEVGIALGSR